MKQVFPKFFNPNKRQMLLAFLSIILVWIAKRLVFYLNELKIFFLLFILHLLTILILWLKYFDNHKKYNNMGFCIFLMKEHL